VWVCRGCALAAGHHGVRRLLTRSSERASEEAGASATRKLMDEGGSGRRQPLPVLPFARTAPKFLTSVQQSQREAEKGLRLRVSVERAFEARAQSVRQELEAFRATGLVEAIETMTKEGRVLPPEALAFIGDVLVHAPEDDGTATRRQWGDVCRHLMVTLRLHGGPGAIEAMRKVFPCPHGDTVRGWAKDDGVPYVEGGRAGEPRYERMLDEVVALVVQCTPEELVVQTRTEGQSGLFKAPFNLCVDDTAVQPRRRMGEGTMSLGVWRGGRTRSGRQSRRGA
jgi:hypothetical protein